MKRSADQVVACEKDSETTWMRKDGRLTSFYSNDDFLKTMAQNGEFSRQTYIRKQHIVHHNKDMQKASCLVGLPDELIVSIIAQLPYADIKSFSQTCKMLKEFVIRNFIIEDIVFPMHEKNISKIAGRYVLSITMDLKTQLTLATHDDSYLQKILSLNLKYLKQLTTIYCEGSEFMNMDLMMSKPIDKIIDSPLPLFHRSLYLQYVEILISDDLIATLAEGCSIFQTISKNLKFLHELVLQPRIVTQLLDIEIVNIIIAILLENESVKILRLKRFLVTGFQPFSIDASSERLEVLEICDQFEGYANMGDIDCPNLKSLYFNMDAEENLNKYCLYHGVKYSHNTIAEMLSKSFPSLEVYNKTDIKKLKEMCEMSGDDVNQWFKVLETCDEVTAGCQCPPYVCNTDGSCGENGPEVA